MLVNELAIHAHLFIQGESIIFNPTTFDAPWFSGNESWSGEQGLFVVWESGLSGASPCAIAVGATQSVAAGGFQRAIQALFERLFSPLLLESSLDYGLPGVWVLLPSG